MGDKFMKRISFKIKKICLAIISIMLLNVFIFCFIFTNKTFENYNVSDDIWSIGIYSGKDIMHLSPQEEIKNPVLTTSDILDRPAKFVADPFIIKEDEKWYMFFEILDKKTHKGVIGLATSNDFNKWEYKSVVLEEEFHLSYPYIFKYDNNFYMLPEGGNSGYLNLYKAVEFPYKWKRVSSLLRGCYLDSSIFRYDNIWWILSVKKEGDHIKNNNLHLYYSRNLTDGWKEHPKSPIITDNPKIARPAGRVIVDYEKIIRFAQDDSVDYGKNVSAFVINKLTPTDYEEKQLGIVIQGTEKENNWNKNGMHQIDAYKTDDGGYIAVVDGKYTKKYNIIIENFKNRLINKFKK